MSDDTKMRAKARQKALADLGRKYREEYQALYRTHLEALGLDPRVSRRPNPFGEGEEVTIETEDSVIQAWVPVAFETCPHDDREADADGVTTCKRCGGKRPYFSWVPPTP